MNDYQRQRRLQSTLAAAGVILITSTPRVDLYESFCANLKSDEGNPTPHGPLPRNSYAAQKAQHDAKFKGNRR